MTDARPRVSVIVPVRNRRALLRMTLNALAQQTVQDHQIIVVDDGSTDGSGDEARADAAAGRPVLVLDGGGRGAVAARTLAVRHAAAPVLAFTDSDCRPEPEWLEAGLRHIDAGAAVVQGQTLPDGAVAVLDRTVYVTSDEGLYPTCNLLLTRAAFDRAGGFDGGAGDRLGFRPGRSLRDLGFGEDTLLGWRVRKAELSAWAPDMVVRHHVFAPDLRDHFRRAWNSGGFAQLVAEVPELRRTFLRWRFSLGPPVRVPLYAAVVFAIAGARRASVLCLTGWIGAHGRALRHAGGGRRRRILALPVVLAADAVTAASMVAGSVRARQVVL